MHGSFSVKVWCLWLPGAMNSLPSALFLILVLKENHERPSGRALRSARSVVAVMKRSKKHCCVQSIRVRLWVTFALWSCASQEALNREHQG